jgi:hypothetical protein
MVLHFILLLALTTGSAPSQQARIGEIDFFGAGGIDVEKVRSALPVREGEVVSEDQSPDIRDRTNRAIERAVGHLATDIAIVCCDEHAGLIIYIGLGGSNTSSIPLNPAPKGSTCLPRQAVTLYDEAMEALEQAVRKGNSGEDDTQGYSLSKDATARAKQMAMHEYAMTHEQRLEGALQACGKPEQRQAAAALLGYGKKSAAQIRALVYASRDSDEEVRNNAVRALWVLAMASPKTTSEIPANSFVQMLNSGLWTDRNKAGLLLMALTGSRPPQLLERLRTEGLPSLIEMARWHDSSHARAYQELLGRIAGFDEARIEQLIASRKVDEIIAAARNKPGRVM